MEFGRLLKRIIKKQFQDDTLVEEVLAAPLAPDLKGSKVERLISRLPNFLISVNESFIHLENKVEMYYHNLNKSSEEQLERIKALKDANELIKNLMNSLSEGYLSVDLSGRILPVYSTQAEHFFGTPLTGVLWWERMGFTEKIRVKTEEWYQMLALDRFDFEDIVKLGPTQVAVKDRHFNLDYKPLRDSKGVLTGVVVVAVDVTGNIKAKQDWEEMNARVEFFARVMADPRPFQSFANYLQSQATKFIKQEELPKAENYTRWLHDLKGSCQHFGIPELGPITRRLETEFLSLSQEQVTTEIFRNGAEAILNTFKAFLKRHEKVLPPDLIGADRTVKVPLSRLVTWGSQLSAHGFEQDAQGLLTDYVMIPLSSFFRDTNESLVRRAIKQDKRLKVEFNLVDLRLPPTPEYEYFFSSLQHILNNMVDHGIQFPDDREFKGKTPEGHITLNTKILNGGRNLLVSISDDGDGLDLERIRQKAIELNLPSTSEDDVKKLIFRQGFSTRTEVSEYAGRGEGLWSVAKAVHNLKGKIEVTTTTGQGVRFDITVPVLGLALDTLLQTLSA